MHRTADIGKASPRAQDSHGLFPRAKSTQRVASPGQKHGFVRVLGLGIDTTVGAAQTPNGGCGGGTNRKKEPGACSTHCDAARAGMASIVPGGHPQTVGRSCRRSMQFLVPLNDSDCMPFGTQAGGIDPRTLPFLRRTLSHQFQQDCLETAANIERTRHAGCALDA
jgi:hypothetical protein